MNLAKIYPLFLQKLDDEEKDQILQAFNLNEVSGQEKKDSSDYII